MSKILRGLIEFIDIAFAVCFYTGSLFVAFLISFEFPVESFIMMITWMLMIIAELSWNWYLTEVSWKRYLRN